MIDIRMKNAMAENEIRVVKGTLSEIRDLMKREPELKILTPMKDGSGCETQNEKGEYFDLFRNGPDNYSLRYWDEDEFIHGTYGDVMYQAVKRGWLKNTGEIQWTWYSETYWDIKNQHVSNHEYRLAVFLETFAGIQSNLDFTGEITWTPSMDLARRDNGVPAIKKKVRHNKKVKDKT